MKSHSRGVDRAKQSAKSRSRDVDRANQSAKSRSRGVDRASQGAKSRSRGVDRASQGAKSQSRSVDQAGEGAKSRSRRSIEPARSSQVEQVERMGLFFRPIWPTGPRFWVAGVISDRFLERLAINFRSFPLRARSRNANSATCVSTCKNAYEKRVRPHARHGKIAKNCPEIDASSEKSIEGRRSSRRGRQKSLEAFDRAS